MNRPISPSGRVSGCLLHPRDPRPIQLAKLQLVDLAEHRHHNIALPQLDGEPGSGEQAPAAASRLAELRRASHRGYRHRDRTPSLRPECRLFELERNLLVLAGEQSRAVPRPAVGLIRQHLRQGLMHTPAIPHARALRDRRPNERMAEAERLKIDVDDPRLDRRHSNVEIQGSPGDFTACVQHLADRVSVIECGNQQDQPSLIRQLGDTSGECTLETLGQRQRPWCPSLVLVLANHAWQLDERERVSRRFAQDPAARRERKLGCRYVEQLCGHRVVEAAEPVLRQAGIAEHRGVAVTGGSQQDDRVRLDSPSNESEHLRRRTIEPLCVLGDQQQRGIGGDLRDEVERGHRNSIVLRGRFVRQAEGGVERGALNRGQLRHAPAHGTQQLMQPGKWEMRFGLDASGREHRHAALPRSPRSVRQKPRLADTRLAAKHQRLAMNRDLVQQ